MKILGKVLLAFVLAVLCTELILEVFFRKHTGWTQDPLRGKILQTGIYVNGTEGFCRTTIGPYGMRMADIHAKKEGEYRIVVLGDSFTEAFQVSDDEIYTRKVEAALNARRPARPVYVINAGKSGAYPGDYIGQVDFVKNLQPDYVIIQLSPGDLTSDLTSSGTTFRLVKKEHTYALERGVESGGMEDLLGRYSSSLSFLSSISLFRRTGEMVMTLRKHESTGSTPVAQPSAKVKQEQEQAAMIRWLIYELKAAYPNLVLLYLPQLDYFTESKTTIPACEQVLSQVSTDAHIDLINMRQPFLDHYARTVEPSHGFNNTTPGVGHINPIGHALVSQALAEYLVGKISR